MSDERFIRAFTHDSVRWTLSSDGGNTSRFSWVEVLPQRWSVVVWRDSGVWGTRCTWWFPLKLVRRVVALWNVVIHVISHEVTSYTMSLYANRFHSDTYNSLSSCNDCVYLILIKTNIEQNNLPDEGQYFWLWQCYHRSFRRQQKTKFFFFG